mgnify:CR=1 FL=1
MSDLTHFNQAGEAHMVDVGDKSITKRVAVAEGQINMLETTLELIKQGNHKLKFKHSVLQNDIDELLASTESASLNSFSQWESFCEHWPRLKQHAVNNTLDTHSLMRQHSAMIEGQLSLIDDVTREYHLHMIMLDESIQMSGICIDTLRTAETIAQARGVGAGMCALGKSINSDKINLNFLTVLIASSTTNLFDELSTIKNPDIDTHLGSASVDIKNSADKLVGVIENKIIKQENIHINSQDYFDIATLPIDELSTLFKQIINYTTEKYAQEY